jgi:hypothetical protein
MKKSLLVFIIFMAGVVFTSCGLDSSNISDNLNSTTDEIISDSTVTSELSDTQTETTTNESASVVTDTTKASENTPIITKPTQVSESTPIIIEPTQAVNSTLINYENILLQLNSYQLQYFEICKIIEKNGTPEEFAQRDELFVDVASKVSQDNEYYNRYIRIEPDINNDTYGYTEVPDDFFHNPTWTYLQQYEKYDELLNDLYSYVKLQIPTEAFDNLKDSELQWIKDKEEFLKILPGDEDDRYALSYKAEITKYRCLLLMLYLDDTTL